MSAPTRGRRSARACVAVVAVTLLVAGPTAASASPPRLDAKAWVLIDSRDDSVLASTAANKRLPIASATKLMTAYLALKRLRPNQQIVAPAYHPRSSLEILLGLRQGERIRVRDLLAGALLPSANDAAQTLAAGVSGSVPAFVAAMNQAARRLGSPTPTTPTQSASTTRATTRAPATLPPWPRSCCATSSSPGSSIRRA